MPKTKSLEEIINKLLSDGSYLEEFGMQGEQETTITQAKKDILGWVKGRMPKEKDAVMDREEDWGNECYNRALKDFLKALNEIK